MKSAGDWQRRFPITPIVVGVAIGIGLAGTFGYWAIDRVERSSSGPPVVVGNGVTFSQAWLPVNASLAAIPGGPWRLTSVIGIATEVPESPVPTFGQYVGLNTTMAICGNLTGVTAWNSSGIPLFTGSLNSGGAPFWSFVLKNDSGAFLYITSILGSYRIYPPSVATPCVEAAGGKGWAPLNASITNDTRFIAGLAYSASGENFSLRHSPLAEYYILGGSQLIEPDASYFGWVVNYFRCDTVGVVGIQNYSAVGVLSKGSQTTTFVDNGWIGCTTSGDAYSVAFSATVLNTTPTGSRGDYLSVPFQVAFPVNGTMSYDGWGLQAWMTVLRLDGSGGESLAAGSATCGHWVPSLSDCPADSTGWFAVLQSADGGWLDSFPSAQNPANWSIPNVLMTSHDRLVVVLPPDWAVIGDTLEISSTISALTVSGTATI